LDPPFVFNNISGCTFIFEGQEPEVSIRMLAAIALGLQTSDPFA
jgi:hypothetical protein